MTNFEKWKDDVLLATMSGSSIALVNGIPKPCSSMDSCRGCDLYDGSGFCTSRAIKWLYEEYKEPTVDWSKVPVDTPILVSRDGVEWRKRYFSKLLNGKVCAWDSGTTSWSSDSYTQWNYAKLAKELV